LSRYATLRVRKFFYFTRSQPDEAQVKLFLTSVKRKNSLTLFKKLAATVSYRYSSFSLMIVSESLRILRIRVHVHAPRTQLSANRIGSLLVA